MKNQTKSFRASFPFGIILFVGCFVCHGCAGFGNCEMDD